MAFSLLWDTEISSILSSGSPFGTHRALKPNYMLTLNKFLTTRRILDLKVTFDRVHQDLCLAW